MTRKEKLIELRGGYMPYEKAEEVQKELINIYDKEYKPKHSKSEYFDLIINNGVGEVKERHEQTTNWPDKVFECFSVASQHVYGYTKEHCLDQIWQAIADKKERIEYYKTLPTLKELVESDIKIDANEMYNYKNNQDGSDSCGGYSGSIIIEMRKIGIDEWHSKESKRQWEFFDPDGKAREALKNHFWGK